MHYLKLVLFILLLPSVWCAAEDEPWEKIPRASDIVTVTTQIELKDYPDAFNPSIINFNDGFLLSFRHCPDRDNYSQISYIGVVLLDENLKPISEPQLLNTRGINDHRLSQSEDARIFAYRDRLFLIFNDNVEIGYNPSAPGRRDMYIAELFCSDNKFSVSSSLKLVHEEKYDTQLWQKNWVPFEYNNRLFLTYTISPHEVLTPNFLNGSCYTVHMTNPHISWDWGLLRGSTPPVLVDGEYLAFLHSVTKKTTDWVNYFQYFIGAYTFSAEPPFKLTRISPYPIGVEEFYSPSHTPSFKVPTNYKKKVVFPGGMAVSGSNLYVAYGKDDSEIWIATIDKAALMKSLVKVD